MTKYANTEQGERFERQLRNTPSMPLAGYTIHAHYEVGMVVRTDAGSGSVPVAQVRRQDGSMWTLTYGDRYAYTIPAESVEAAKAREMAIREAVEALEL